MMDKFDLETKAIGLRDTFGVDAFSPVDIFALASNMKGVSLVMYPFPQNISGMCVKDSKAKLLGINSTMTLGRQRFSLAHEMYHLYYDSIGFHVCTDNIDSSNEIEREANIFASFFLMPETALNKFLVNFDNKNLSLYDVISLEQRFGISHQAMLWRLQSSKIISQETRNAYAGKPIISTAKKMGYDVKLYRCTENNNQYRTYGAYIKNAEKVFEKNYVSVGKYEELLLEAFRDDLVYDEPETEAIQVD